MTRDVNRTDMLSEIDNLTQELKTDKVQQRAKAFSKLFDILTHRLSELQRLIDSEDEISWEVLFKATHKGVLNHSNKLSLAGLNENDPKIANYSKVILKLCDSASNGE